MSKFNPTSRAQTIEALTSKPLDLLIIGGGIVGSGIARDAAMRGLRVGLVEQYDFAFGTSSRSSRLLHGGLRYLAQGRVGLVHEASVEKKVVHHIAPHLADPLAFVFPTYSDNRDWKLWQLKIGVKIYDLLCGGRNLGASTWLNKAKTLKHVPGLTEKNLSGAVRYYDGLTNDARLVLDTLRSAAKNGAALVNYVKFENAKFISGHWDAELSDKLSSEKYKVRARAVVNATGPWADGLPHSNVKLRLTKGIHLVVERARLSVPDAIVMTEGKRILFVIPWGERTIVGTTDTDYNGPLDDVRANAEDISYVLKITNQFFPKAKLSEENVISSWAGLRPLIANANGKPSDISRSHEIKMPEPFWWDVAGGKLTTYRLMAEQTVDQIAKKLGGNFSTCRTAQEPLLSQKEIDGISGIVPPDFCKSSVEHFCANEWARNLDDVMIRRTSWHYYFSDAAERAEKVADWMAEILSWSENEKVAQLQRYKKGRQNRIDENFRGKYNVGFFQMSQPSPSPNDTLRSDSGSNPSNNSGQHCVFSAFAKFFRTGPDAVPLTDEGEIKRTYKKNRISVFLSITLGYAMYYVIRQGYAVVKKPLLEAKIFDALQLGKIGSVFFFTYMIGKCVNGFLADRLNIKRFLALGLLGSATLLVILGFCSSFYLFAILWGTCGWFQTFGAAPCVVSLNQWFSNKERGTLYGIWFSAHNIGTGLTYIITAYIVAAYGWRMGFYAPGLLGISSAIFLYLFMYDRPQVYGLPPIAVYSGEQTHDEHKAGDHKPVFKAQLAVLIRPAVWILGLSSAACYVTRYAFESWGVVFLTESKGYTLTKASAIISISQFAGIAGAVTCGLISDKFFNHKRSVPCFLFGIVFVLSTAAFVYVPAGNPWSDYVSMTFFGYTVYALVAYLGGLMAVDICSKKATGAAMGVIGLFSYAGATLQEVVGGYLINAHKVTAVGGKAIYDFKAVGNFWVIASVFALILPLFVWNAKQED